jgi:hypothetical protein
MNDPINPSHYRNTQSVQLIEVIRWLPFSIGNAIKYVYRNAQKENSKQDLTKALWYLDDFVAHPTCGLDDSKITENRLKSVLNGLDTFETTCCNALLDVYWAHERSYGLQQAAANARAHIKSRINMLEKETQN